MVDLMDDLASGALRFAVPAGMLVVKLVVWDIRGARTRQVVEMCDVFREAADVVLVDRGIGWESHAGDKLVRVSGSQVAVTCGSSGRVVVDVGAGPGCVVGVSGRAVVSPVGGCLPAGWVSSWRWPHLVVAYGASSKKSARAACETVSAGNVHRRETGPLGRRGGVS